MILFGLRIERVSKIELDMDEKTWDGLTELSEMTGFSIDKLVEYGLANFLISQSIKGGCDGTANEEVLKTSA